MLASELETKCLVNWYPFSCGGWWRWHNGFSASESGSSWHKSSIPICFLQIFNTSRRRYLGELFYFPLSTSRRLLGRTETKFEHFCKKKIALRFYLRVTRPPQMLEIINATFYFAVALKQTRLRGYKIRPNYRVIKKIKTERNKKPKVVKGSQNLGYKKRISTGRGSVRILCINYSEEAIS